MPKVCDCDMRPDVCEHGSYYGAEAASSTRD
jgi:hypothetical protein